MTMAETCPNCGVMGWGCICAVVFPNCPPEQAPYNPFWQGDPPRFGRVPRTTIDRDFDKLRKAIRDHDPFAAEEAWEKCERWLGALPLTREGEG